MELRHLRYFTAVADCLNFTQAAKRLHIAQPALSRQIKDLEDDLGAPLFERDSRSVRLTAAGKVLAEESRAVLRRVDEAVAAVRGVSGGLCGEVRIGYAPSPSAEVLPTFLHALQGEMPSVRVQTFDLSSTEMLAGLKGRTLDVALLPVSGMTIPRELRALPLASYPVCAAMKLSHALAGKASLGHADLAKAQLSGFCEEGYPEYHGWLREAFAGFDLQPVLVHTVDSLHSLIADLQISDRLALVPSCFQLSAGALKLIPLRPAPQPLILALCCCREGLSPPAMRAVKVAEMLAANAAGK